MNVVEGLCTNQRLSRSFSTDERTGFKGNEKIVLAALTFLLEHAQHRYTDYIRFFGDEF